MGRGSPPALAGSRARGRGHHRPPGPRGDDRYPRPGLHPDGPGQGPLPSRRSSASTPSRTRSSPAVTVIGISFGYLLGGTVIIEQIFSLPGIGTYVLQAISVEGPADHPGRGPGHRAVLRHHQPGRRHRLRVPQPEGPTGVSLVTPPATRIRWWKRPARRPEMAPSADNSTGSSTLLRRLPTRALRHRRPPLPPSRDRGCNLRPAHRALQPDRADISSTSTPGPSGAHWLGTDDLGRDILSRLIWGARTSLRATVEIVGIAAAISLPLGLIAGFFRGAVDSVTMRLMDAMFSFPPLILALTVAALLGASINDTALAIGDRVRPRVRAPHPRPGHRGSRGEFIEAARSLGASSIG